MVYTSEREDLVNRCQARRQNLGPSRWNRPIVLLDVDAEIYEWLLVHKSVHIFSSGEIGVPEAVTHPSSKWTLSSFTYGAT